MLWSQPSGDVLKLELDVSCFSQSSAVFSLWAWQASWDGCFISSSMKTKEMSDFSQGSQPCCRFSSGMEMLHCRKPYKFF